MSSFNTGPFIGVFCFDSLKAQYGSIRLGCSDGSYQSPPSSASTEQPWFLAKYVSLAVVFCHGSGALCAPTLLGAILNSLKSPSHLLILRMSSRHLLSSDAVPHQTMF